MNATDYIDKRLTEQIYWYSRQSLKCKRLCKLFKLISNLKGPYPYWRMDMAGAEGVGALLQLVNSLSRYVEVFTISL